MAAPDHSRLIPAGSTGRASARRSDVDFDRSAARRPMDPVSERRRVEPTDRGVAWFSEVLPRPGCVATGNEIGSERASSGICFRM